MGRRKIITQEILETAQSAGQTVEEVASRLGVSESSVASAAWRQGVKLMSGKTKASTCKAAMITERLCRASKEGIKISQTAVANEFEVTKQYVGTFAVMLRRKGWTL